MKKHLFTLVLSGLSFFSFGQTAAVQNASIPKDAPIDETVTDFKNNALPQEIIIFKSKMSSKEYQGITGESGKFSTRLPAGDTYEIFILGFKDSTSYNFLEIPAPQGNAYYKKPFVVDIQFLPAKTFVLDNCTFETGQATLQPEAFTVLDELVAYLNRKDDQRIEIGGHTDNVGKAASNLKLSMDRATSVMNYLISKGINPARLEAKGYGMTEPVEDNGTAAGRAQNRRTEVKVLD